MTTKSLSESRSKFSNKHDQIRFKLNIGPILIVLALIQLLGAKSPLSPSESPEGSFLQAIHPKRLKTTQKVLLIHREEKNPYFTYFRALFGDIEKYAHDY